MKQQMKKLLWVFSLAAVALATIAIVKNNVEAQSSTSDVNLSVSGGAIVFNAPSSGINLGSVNLSSTGQELSGKYVWGIDTGNYRVEDLNWYTWWAIYISVTNLTWQTNSGYVISWSNVSMSWDTVYTYAGQDLGTANANITGLVQSPYISIWSPVTLMKRPVATNTGLVGKYRVQPWIKVTIPAYTPAQAYKGTIYLTIQAE